MDVDLILEPDLTPNQITELGQAAEKYGIRAIWTSNYFAHWDAFIGHPEWDRMKKMAKYKNTVSNITKVYLVPTGYSQI